jgi:hypothetical protein
MHSRSRTVADGIVAGIIGAVVIALWFFLFDIAQGRPFETVTLLGEAIFNGPKAHVLAHNTMLLVAPYVIKYTAFHFAAFMLIGAVGALMLEPAEREPALFGSLLIFVIAFQIFFIAVAMLMGPAAAAAAPWWKVIIGNLMATAAMLAYFFARNRELGRNLLGPWVDVAREGAIAGAIGGLIVAVWFFGCDAAAGQMLRTPALLGATIFGGGTLVITADLVLGYTALHFFAFVMFGIAAAVMVAGAEREPLLVLGVLVLFAWSEVVFAGLVTFLDHSALQQLGWWKIVVGNIMALAGMGAYFGRTHAGVWPRLVERWGRLGAEEVRPAVRRGPARGRPSQT